MSEIEKQTFKILLADDHSLIRQGVLFLLDDLEESFETFQVSNLKQILEKISQIKIDLAIIDAFPDGNSISILTEIKNSPETKILIFTGLMRILTL
jgi:DNA-binding NarL/FixJ family response regulator